VIARPAPVERAKAPLAPIHHQRRANRWLAECRRAVRDAGVRAPGAAGDIDLIDALRSPLNLRNGNVLMALAADAPAARSPDGSLHALRLMLYRARRELRQGCEDLLERARLQAAMPRAPIAVLAVPRTSGHLLDQLPVARGLAARGARVVFALPDEALVDATRAQGFEAVLLARVSGHGAPGPIAVRRLRRDLVRAIARGPGARSEGFTPDERSALCAATHAGLRENLNVALRAASGLAFLLDTLRPRLVLPGNPYTMEGRIAAMLAKVRGIPSAALEHGSIFPEDPIWQECVVDRVCAWGEPSRRALQSCGVGEERIAVTGAPRLDPVVHAASAARPPSVLVATSGAGDQVSAETHQRFIEWLYQAAAAVPEARFVVKLHRKDRPELYAAARAHHPGAQVEVVVADRKRFGGDIFEYLRGARALVTLYSTAALDAMVVGVPVITAVPGPVPRGIEFLERGCTRDAASAAALAAEIRRAWAGEPAPTSDAAARAYAAEHYAHLGQAAEATAASLASLLEEARRG
jgi:hypothetical protein